jgi:hypothetical protein
MKIDKLNSPMHVTCSGKEAAILVDKLRRIGYEYRLDGRIYDDYNYLISIYPAIMAYDIHNVLQFKDIEL